jgi:hypothetical protein
VPTKACIVSLTDPGGMKHSVEVQADSLYEAAARGLRMLRNDGWTPHTHGSARIEIEVREPGVTHSIPISRLEAWLHSYAIQPKDFLRKQQLRELLYGPATPDGQ